MKVKTILLPKSALTKPVPHFDIGSIAANIKSKCQDFQLINLETNNYFSKKYKKILEKIKGPDVFKKKNATLINSIIKDIGNINFDIFYFYIDWWNETLPLAIAVAYQIKKLNKKSKILLSGPYLNSYGKEILSKFKFIDYIAVSEIEPVFDKILTPSINNSEIPNIIYYNNKRKMIVETKKQVDDINNILFPEFDLFTNQDRANIEVLPFRLSRGCKYRCFFCACLSAEKLRYYNDIAPAIKQLKIFKNKYSTHYFYFEDDAMNFDNIYLESFLDRLTKAKLNIRWSAYFIAKNLSPDLIDKIAKAGCIHIRWGIESANPSILKKIAKNIVISEAEAILEHTAKAGISNQISLIVGFPHEKKSSINLMKNFIIRNKQSIKIVNVYNFKPRVGTLANKFPQQYKIKILKDDSIFKEDIIPFEEIESLTWNKKKIAQKTFFDEINTVIQDNKLLNIDPKEYFQNKARSGS